MYSYVKLNFKADLFSSTWFEHSFLAESSFLVYAVFTLLKTVQNMQYRNTTVLERFYGFGPFWPISASPTEH